jgi:predicted NBD/HSP70 family sugar kinase
MVARASFPTASGGTLMERCKGADDRIAFTLSNWEAFVTLRTTLLDEVGDSIRALFSRLKDRDASCVGVGVSAPGAIHPFTGEILGRTGALNLPAWGDFNLNREMESRIGFPVRSINDAKAMALGALARMESDVITYLPAEKEPSWVETPLGEEGRKIRDFIELDPGTGLGGAYIVNGKVWFGPDPKNPDPEVGEIWKLKVDPDRKDVPLEELTSGRVTLRRVEERLRTEAPEEAAILLEEAKGHLKAMFKTARPKARKFIEDEIRATGRFLGLGIKHLMTHEKSRLRAPDIRNFVIGGGLVSGVTEEARHVRTLLHEAIHAAVRDLDPPVRILFVLLGGKAGLYGSAALLNEMM